MYFHLTSWLVFMCTVYTRVLVYFMYKSTPRYWQVNPVFNKNPLVSPPITFHYIMFKLHAFFSSFYASIDYICVNITPELSCFLGCMMNSPKISLSEIMTPSLYRPVTTIICVNFILKTGAYVRTTMNLVVAYWNLLDKVLHIQ